jgi:CRP/FNR family transcriptional regulator
MATQGGQERASLKAERIIKYLKQVPMFSDLKEEDLERLSSMTVARGVAEGENLFHDGDEAKGFYLLTGGRLKVFKITPEGREQILHFISPGETFAEVALFSGSTYPAGAQALEAGEVIFFPRDGLLKMVRKNPQLSLNIMAGFAKWVRQFNRLLSEYTKAVPSRLAGYLLAEALQQQPSALADGAKVRLTVNKTEIAALLGTISATLSRAFAQLRDAGLIEVSDREVVIRDLSRLRDIASGAAIRDAES